MIAEKNVKRITLMVWELNKCVFERAGDRTREKERWKA